MLYDMAATCAAEGLTSSLLITALTKRFVLSQFIRPILPEESMIKAISKRGLHSLSKEKKCRVQSPKMSEIEQYNEKGNDNILDYSKLK